MSSSNDAKTEGIRALDDLYPIDATEPVFEDDDLLREMIAGSELPVLLAAIAAATKDTSILHEELRPVIASTLMPQPHGGMDSEQIKKATEIAFAGLKKLSNEKITTVEKLTEDEARAILLYLTGGRENWINLLKHELNFIFEGGGRPTWKIEDISPEQQFPTLIVGAGVAGIAAAHRFGQAGIDFTIIESEPEVGGTWWKNTYPGVRLDTPTFVFSYSFAQKDDWPHQFAEGSEILEYLRDVSKRTSIQEKIEFSTTLIRLRWNEDTRLWEATTRGLDGVEQLRLFSAVITSVGQLDRPNIPDFPGKDLYRGVTMHSQEWNHDLDFTNKRVAVIGTGASAYQIVPSLIDSVDTLVLFQRNAPWMMPAPNYYDRVPDAFSWLRRKIPHYGRWFRLWIFIATILGRSHYAEAEEGWGGAPLSSGPDNQTLRDFLVSRLEEQFADRPDLLAASIPNYPPNAKRMARDNGVWAAALKSEKTTLVTQGIERFTETGILDTAGVEHEVDVIVFATGFKPSEYLENIEVYGCGGKEIHEVWGGDARAYNGVTVPGFPNLFMIFGPNVGLVVSGTVHFMFERAVEYSLAVIRKTLERGATAAEVRPEALERFSTWMDTGNSKRAWGQPYVDSWYKNRFGRVSQIWPYTIADYWDATEHVNEDDYEFTS